MGAAAGRGEWWKGRLWRALQLNIEDPYGFYADRLDADKVLEVAERVKANLIVVFARDAWGRVFYSGSKLYPRHPNSKLDLAELASKARASGLRVVVMADHTANRYVYRKHPGWAQRNRKGEVIVLEHYPVKERVRDPQWPQICPNSPAMELYFIPEAEEAISSTGADGLLLDSFRYLPDPPRACYCRYCRLRFKVEYDINLPGEEGMEDEAFRTAWEWRYDVVVAAIRRLRDVVKSVKPNAMFFYNSHPAGWAGRGNVVVEKAREYLDAAFAEASEADVMSSYMLTMATKLTRAVIGDGKPVFVSRNLFYNLRTVQSPPPPVIRQGVRSIVASGGHPMATVFSSQVFEDPRGLDALADVYEELDRLEHLIGGSTPVRYAAIIYDTDTHEKRYWDAPHFYVSELEGFALMHIHRHLPWEFLSTRDLDKLGAYPVVIAANTVVVTDEEERAYRRYVEEGGFLVATHEFGTMRDDYTYTHALALEDVLGATYEGIFHFGYVYLHLGRQGDETYDSLWSGLPEAIVFGDFSTAFTRERAEPRLGELVRARPTTGKVLAWGRMGRSAYGYEYTLGRSTPAPDSVLDMAGVLLGGSGRGRTLYYAVRLGAHYARLGHPDYGELYFRPLERFGPEPPALCDAPESVQAEYYARGDSLMVHLVNMTFNERILSAPLGPSKQSLPPFMPSYSVHPARSVIPVSDLRLRLKWDGGPARAYDALTERDLEVETKGGYVDVRIPRLDEYMLVVVEPRG